MRRSLVRRSALGIAFAALTACGLFASPGDYAGGGSGGPDADLDGASPSDALVTADTLVLPDGNVVPASIGTITVVAGERDPSSPEDNPAWSADTWSGVIEPSGRVASWKVERSALIVGPFDSAGLVGNTWCMINTGLGISGNRGTALQMTTWGPGVVGDWRAARIFTPGGLDEHARIIVGTRVLTIGGTRTVAVDGGTNTFFVDDVFLAAVDTAAGTLGGFSDAVSLENPRSRPGVGAGGGFLYVVGGRAPGGITASVEMSKLDPGTGEPQAFSVQPQLLNAGQEHRVFASSVVVASGYLYVAGGRTNLANNPSDVVLAAKIDPATGALSAFQPVTKLPRPLRDFAFVSHAGTLYVIGGIGDTGQRTDAVLAAKIAADGTLGAWDGTSAKLPAPRSDFAAVAY